MRYQPASLSETQITNIIQTIENSRDPYIDQTILSTAVKLIYQCGLKKSEIIKLKIKDILANGEIVNEIKSCEKTIDGRTLKLRLPDQIKTMLRDYINYLKKNEYNLTPNSPLFPQKNNTAYTDAQLRRHMDKLFPVTEHRLEKIRQAGFMRILRELSNQDITDSDTRIAKVAEYARTSKRNIDKFIYGNRRRPDNNDDD
jgi:integrase